MKFIENQPIYLQIVDWVGEKILQGEWREGERIPSVRELASQLEVNPNTVMRSYEKLQEQEVIYNQRGIGFFASPGAISRIRKERRDAFTEEEIPRFFEKMKLLSIGWDEIGRQYEQYNLKNDEDKQ